MANNPATARMHEDVDADERTARLETALRRAEKVALAGRFAASVMHEISNPSQAIGDLVYLLSREADHPDLVRLRAAQIEEQLDRIQHISRQTLSFFRETPQAQLKDLVPLVETALRYHAGLMQVKGIHLVELFPETLVALVYPGDFLQLVSNLVRNAVEALPTGGTLRVRLRARRYAGGTQARLIVSDNGRGIPASMQKHLFEAFQTNKAEAGNGLGLWISKTIAEKHGGTIRVKSMVGGPRQGTTFLVVWPLERVSPSRTYRAEGSFKSKSAA